MYKLILLERLRTYREMFPSKMTAEDKIQVEKVHNAILQLLEAPQERDLGFIQQAKRAALKVKIKSLGAKR